MSKFLSIAAMLLFLVWAIGFFIYDFGNTIHLFLALSTLVFIIKVLKEN